MERQNKNSFINNSITPRSVDFTKWYDDILQAANLIHYGKVKGTIIFTHISTFIWEQIKQEVDKYFKRLEIKNMIFPTLIPYSSFALEKEHLNGFAPEMFLITKKSIGGEEISDPLVLRPTSEILFSYYFKETLVSYNQLPFKFNQWANVFRVEKNTRPFLRTSEFLWQELHSLHDSETEAIEFVKKVNDSYKEIIEQFLCIPVLNGEKTENERFAGANNTFTCEALMQDGQALQCATSHFLSQNFSRPYDIKYRNKNNKLSYPYQTSEGMSTRIIGALIMVHSDDMGLVLPWNLALNQIIICTLKNNDNVLEYANTLKDSLLPNRVYIDNTNKSMGYKIKEHQVSGTPIIMLIGDNEVKDNKITIIFRNSNDKISVDKEYFINNINEYVNDYQKKLYEKANNHLKNSIKICYTLDEVKNTIKNKHIALAPWGGNKDDEERFKKLTAISPRCIKKANEDKNLKCFYTQNEATHWVYFAKSY